MVQQICWDICVPRARHVPQCARGSYLRRNRLLKVLVDGFVEQNRSSALSRTSPGLKMMLAVVTGVYTGLPCAPVDYPSAVTSHQHHCHTHLSIANLSNCLFPIPQYTLGAAVGITLMNLLVQRPKQHYPFFVLPLWHETYYSLAIILMVNGNNG